LAFTKSRGTVVAKGHASSTFKNPDQAVSQPAPGSREELDRAINFHRQGRLEEAEALFRQTLQREPENFDALHLLGAVLVQKGDHQLAIDLLSDAIKIRPTNAAVHFILGNAMLELSRYEDALVSYGEALKLEPHYADALVNRGNALLLLARREEALASYNRALDLQPDNALAWINRAKVHLDLNRPEEALTSCERVFQLGINDVEAFYIYGTAQRFLKRDDVALDSFDRALRIDPNHLDALNSRGLVLSTIGRTDEALACYQRAIQLDPQFIYAHINESICRLQNGDFATGWQKYELRLRLSQCGTAPVWHGEDLTGKTLLITMEQGFGDMLQFIRYAALVAQRGAAVFVSAPPELHRLLLSVDDIAKVVAENDLPQGIDFSCPLMSLPHRFGTRLETIPRVIPYLHAENRSVERWNQRLSQDHEPTALRVGLVWAGNARRETRNNNFIYTDARRSLELQQLAPLAQAENVVFYSLQKGEPAGQAKYPPAAMRLVDHTGLLDDFADTAALIMNLDLIISVDTSVVHLAGALGKPVWVLNRFDSCWRWLTDRNDSPWYPSLRLFRQAQPGQWAPVVAEVLQALQERCKKNLPQDR
jgi:tetratricopeptide (TPR) repeat protein